MPTQVQEHISLSLVDWKDMLEEGEKRIKSKFLDALILISSRDRARLLAKREILKREMEEALQKKDGKKLKIVFREQATMLSAINQTK